MNVRITNTAPAGNVMAIHQEDGFVDITVEITAHQSIRKSHAMNNVLCFGDSNSSVSTRRNLEQGAPSTYAERDV